MKLVFEKMGAFLVDLMKLDQPGKGKQELQQDLISLRAGSKETLRSYYIKKIAMVFIVIMAGLLLSIVCFAVRCGEENQIEDQMLVRPDYGEGDRKEQLSVQINGEEAEDVEITIRERTYTEKEKQEFLDQALQKLDQVILGENQSLDEVRKDLVFPDSMEKGTVKINWMTIPYGILDEDGSIIKSEDEKGVLVEIQGTLTCAGKEALYSVDAKVFPKELPEQEQLHQSIQKEVERADAKGSSEETMLLPAQVDGKTLTWFWKRDNPILSILILTVLTAMCLYLQMDQQIHKKAQDRRDQLILDYPDLMWKMAMLLGAGLSIKGTFLRISEQYAREKEASLQRWKLRYVYEEVAFACYEMQSGVPEAEAYERFGRRCQLPEYIHLGSILSQNLKKGAKGLTSLLATEAAAALNDRKSNARKLSERAGTKMLLPMMLMLGIVLVVLMVPAFLSF